jgi:hypothetical protein
MSNECKKARNTVTTTIIILVSILLFCSSCARQKCYSKPNEWGNYR